MTTVKTGDLTKAQIVAKYADINKVQWNKNLGFPSLKAILTAEDFVPTTPGDWTTAPTTQQAALDELAAKTNAVVETDVANTFTAKQTFYDTFNVVDADAVTKIVKFDCGSMTAAKTLTIVPIADNNSKFEIDLTGIVDTKKLSIKAANTSSDAVFTLPAATAVLAGLGTTQTFSGVNTFSGANVHFSTLSIVDQVATPKKVAFSVSGATADKTTTLTFAHSDNRAITFPNATGTLALLTDIGADVRATATVDISASDIAALYATPKQLVAAPSAGQVILVEALEILHTYSTAQYTGGGACKVQYDSTVNGGGTAISADIDAVVKAASTTNLIHRLGSTTLPITAGGVDMAAAGIVAKGVFLSNASGAYTGGNAGNVLKIRVTYRVVTALA